VDTTHTSADTTTTVASASPTPDASRDDDPLARYPTVKSQTRLLEIYQDAFREKRADQVATTESLVAKDDYALQYALSKVRRTDMQAGRQTPTAQ
jgi:hypothetical protein